MDNLKMYMKHEIDLPFNFMHHASDVGLSAMCFCVKSETCFLLMSF